MGDRSRMHSIIIDFKERLIFTRKVRERCEGRMQTS